MKKANQLIEHFINRLVPIDELEDLEDSSAIDCNKAISRIEDPVDVLPLIYERIPFRLPPLYERLIVNYRWPDSEFKKMLVYGNTIETGWVGLIAKIKEDAFLYDPCIAGGYLPFGKAADGNYDPLCFDYNGVKASKPKIVILCHESILCYGKTAVVKVVAPNFLDFIE